MKVILCAGQLCSGKDSVANYLVSKLNDNWQRAAFASAVKKVYADYFDVDVDFIEQWKRKDEVPLGFDMTVRKSLQWIGDGFRQIRSSIWVDTALKDETKHLVLSDGRYISELKSIHEKGGLNILLWRNGFENNDPHPSEAQIKPLVDYFKKSNLEGDVREFDLNFDVPVPIPEGAQLVDFFIKNDGTLEDLYKKIDLLMPKMEEYFK